MLILIKLPHPDQDGVWKSSLLDENKGFKVSVGAQGWSGKGWCESHAANGPCAANNKENANGHCDGKHMAIVMANTHGHCGQEEHLARDRHWPTVMANVLPWQPIPP